ncbi:hypothetical protein GGR57DRAFT_403135 [Xylariaceae sp. FL1272]|nr:hypothetical protein GGR57DRAFT_403135 [Xylariaceae sp. FL1272]
MSQVFGIHQEYVHYLTTMLRHQWPDQHRVLRRPSPYAVPRKAVICRELVLTTSDTCCSGIHSVGSTGYSCYQVLTTSATDISFDNAEETTTSNKVDTTAFANPISIAWQESDLTRFTPASAPGMAMKSQSITFPGESTTGTSWTTPTSISTTSSPIVSPHTGLSRGAAAGIGVGVTLGVVALIAVLWWLSRNYRLARRNENAEQYAQPVGYDPSKRTRYSAHQARYELKHPPIEAPDTGVPEADYSASTRAELGKARGRQRGLILRLQLTSLLVHIMRDTKITSDRIEMRYGYSNEHQGRFNRHNS